MGGNSRRQCGGSAGGDRRSAPPGPPLLALGRPQLCHSRFTDGWSLAPKFGAVLLEGTPIAQGATLGFESGGVQSFLYGRPDAVELGTE